ncbi:hypothetical protein ID866_3729 [Astraeus odoratus]|nr:hypothetical protein ID866_3729 [Astraeus odoratus]
MKVNQWLSLCGLVASVLPTLAMPPSGTKAKRNSSPFVQINGNSFTVNGGEFKYIGTNAYWLPVLNTDQDINNTLASIAAIGAKVVRVWAFNGLTSTIIDLVWNTDPSPSDVDTIPENGTWFQLVKDGKLTINDGPNGLQRLDTVVQLAEQHGLYVIFSLTNNWFPTVNGSSASIYSRGNKDETITLPRNYLSNDYGGMDLYVSQFGLTHHDQFYTDPNVLNAFKNFTTQVVSRYVDCPSVFSWELANDARCNSTLPATSSCTTETVTTWHATMAQHIRSIDPNHLVSSGTQGYFCPDCPKLYPLNPTPTPQPSPAVGVKKRSSPLTSKQILRNRAESRRRNREAAKRAGTLKEDGIRVRGRWAATATRRQSQDVGSAYDGAYGVDSQDILNIPEIGFGSFQLFPDQYSYAPSDPSLSSYQNLVNQGVEWITSQAQSASAVGKPIVMSSFGILTQNNSADFVPFNMSTAADPDGVTNEEQISAYTTWLDSGISLGVAGMIQYQWGQQNLTAETGTTISPGVTGISSTGATTGTTPSTDTTGVSPNDGYSSNSNSDAIQQTLSTASQNIASD